MPAAAKRPRVWLVALMVLAIGVAAYRIGLWAWGNHQLQSVQSAVDKRHWPAARRTLDRCFWLWPGKTDLHLLAARVARGERREYDVERHLDRCLADVALREAAILEMQLFRVQSGDLGATDGLQRILDEQPQSDESTLVAEALVAGSLAALEPARAAEVLAWWDKHRISQADKVLGLIWRADLHHSINQLEEARALYQTALELDPECRHARLMLVGLLVHPAPDEAQKHLSALLAREPDDPELLFRQALIDRNLGRAEQARTALDRVLAERSEWVEALVQRGLVELDLQQPKAAATWLDRAEKLSPQHREVLLARIEYFRQTGQATEVERHQQQMLRIEAEFRDRLKLALEALQRAKDHPPANK